VSVAVLSAGTGLGLGKAVLVLGRQTRPPEYFKSFSVGFPNVFENALNGEDASHLDGSDFGNRHYEPLKWTDPSSGG
jgi:hypothetical protein